MNLRGFLNNHGLLADAIDADAVIADIILAMEKGLAGDAGSLAMIPTYITAGREIPINQNVIVIDAGGTNLRIAHVSFDHDRRARIEDYSNYPMPGSQKEVAAAEFFDSLAMYLRPVLNKSDKIGFCFSYPAVISSEKDGRLLKWTKEIKAPGVIGRFIGEGLRDALGPVADAKNIVLLNDTTATLLAGRTVDQMGRFGSYVGFILGTGSNTAYLEQNRNIAKAGLSNSSGSQAINVESGNFDKAPRGDIDVQLDSETEDPGSQLFEKMISGRYLPIIVAKALQKGVQEGLFEASSGIWEEIPGQLDHERINNLINESGKGILRSTGFPDAGRESIRSVVKAVIERSAKLAAINITAAVVKAVGENRALPVCITIDGTTYYKAAGLRENTEKYLAAMLGARNIRYTLVHVDQAPMVGAAIAGLVN